MTDAELIAVTRARWAGTHHGGWRTTLADLCDRLEAANADADRLVARLQVHATDEATGYVQDPESEGNDVDFPGMSERWCAADQYAIAAHDERVKAAEADANDLVDREGEAEAYAWWRSQQ